MSDETSGGEDAADPGEVAAFAGRWRRAEHDQADQRYPNEVEFRAEGVYLTPPDPHFREWQAGDYEVAEPGRLTMQTSNDAMVGYDFEFGPDGELVIHDAEGGEIVYLRDEDA